jgi:hypothetical protein
MRHRRGDKDDIGIFLQAGLASLEPDPMIGEDSTPELERVV